MDNVEVGLLTIWLLVGTLFTVAFVAADAFTTGDLARSDPGKAGWNSRERITVAGRQSALRAS